MPSVEQVWADLTTASTSPLSFDPESLEALPEPARRFLARALPAEVALRRAAVLQMVGEIKLGPRWFPFHADEVLRSGVGVVWRPVVGGRILRFVGADVVSPEWSSMEFRLHGWIPMVRAEGEEIARSGAGRLAGEVAMWLPQALTPQAGATWSGIDEHRAVVRLPAGRRSLDVEIDVDDEGRLRSVSMQRWSTAVKPHAELPFGAMATDELVTSEGVRIIAAGAAGWNWGTSGWADGEFFRFRITDVRFVP